MNDVDSQTREKRRRLARQIAKVRIFLMYSLVGLAMGAVAALLFSPLFLGVGGNAR